MLFCILSKYSVVPVISRRVKFDCFLFQVEFMIRKVFYFVCHPTTVLTFDFTNPKWSMHICNVKKNSFPYLPRMSWVGIIIEVVQGESKKSDAFCYSNLPRVTCC